MSFNQRFHRSKRKHGDRARDAGDWKSAAEAYRAYVAEAPEDAAIWVQLGHALKEQGLLEDAADAYARAYQLTPDDSDLHLHFGRLLARITPRLAYREVMLKAYALEPDAAKGGFLALTASGTSRRENISATDAVFFSVHDLITFLKGYPAMSGIQRVQAGIALYALDNSDLNVHFIVNAVSIKRDLLEAGEFWLLSGDHLRAIIEYASGEIVDQAQLRDLIYSAEESAHRVIPRLGQTIILLGAFWGMGNSVQAFVPSWEAGVAIGAYIYDLIPISHPQYCDPGLVRDFSMCFSELCAIADFFLTISDYSGQVVIDFLANNGLRPIPVETVALAHSLTAVSADEPQWPTKLASIEGRLCVTYVSTLEARKNHLFVVRAWHEMMKQGIDVPELVFVGRKGWRVDDLYEYLEETNYLDGKVHIVHDLSDGELNAIYARSHFTVFTSFIEGWGLPVGESLLHGVPCIAARSSSIPEVGGDFVNYVDPTDIEAGVEIFSRAIRDPEFVEARRLRIAREFRPRTWKNVGEEFVSKVRVQARTVNPRRDIAKHIPGIPESRLMELMTLAQPPNDLSSYLHNPWRLLWTSFYPPENIGAWMRSRNGVFRLNTSASEGELVDIHLQLVIAPWALDVSVAIGVNKSIEDIGACPQNAVEGVIFKRDAASLNIVAANQLGEGKRLRVRAKAGPGGLCEVRLKVIGDYEMSGADPRDFAIGLHSVAYARTNNLWARMELQDDYIARFHEISFG